MMELIQHHLNRAQQRMKVQADKLHFEQEFAIGDHVYSGSNLTCRLLWLPVPVINFPLDTSGHFGFWSALVKLLIIKICLILL
uniref:Uncharacterized protein n=1 Tax=Arundo donax TaxID=35708 RepID=A0A0A9FZW4_ARUDO